MYIDNRINGTVFTTNNKEDAKTYIGKRGFFCYSEFAMHNCFDSAIVKTGTLANVSDDPVHPFEMEGSYVGHSCFIPEEFVNTNLRPCSGVYETHSKHTITNVLGCNDQWWDDVVTYNTSRGVLELKYSFYDNIMFECRRVNGEIAEMHVMCNYTLKDWRELIVRYETER